MDTTNIDQFDPTAAKLAEMVEATKNITATDLEDPTQLEVVRKNRIELKKARVQIEKTGKALREEANAYAKAVIAKEKELVAIIEPEEDRLAAIETEAEKLAIRKERLEKLPTRKQRITDANLEFFADKDDDALLELDANGFEAYFNELGARKVQYDADQEAIKREEAARILAEENARKEAELEAERKRIADEDAKRRAEQEAQTAAIEAERRKIEDERRQLEHEKELEAAKKREREETEARMKKETEEKAAREKADAEAKAAAEKAEQEALEKKKAYQQFLASHGYTKETGADFKTFDTPDGIALYKKVGIFKK